MASPALDEIVGDALELDPSEWPRFLEQRCADRPGLAREAESLLGLHRRHPSLLQLPPPVADTPPMSIGRYEIAREVGRGGMGRVFEAYDPKHRRPVALKMLTHSLAADARWRRQFHREAQLLGAMNHPAIARIHTVEESDGLLFLTMELLSGGTLDDRLARGPLSLDESLEIARRITGALEAMHHKDIIHGDLKPTNVALTDEGDVKVLDFGLARYEDRLTGRRRTRERSADSGRGKSGGHSADARRGEAGGRSTDSRHGTAGPLASPHDRFETSPEGTQSDSILGTPGFMAPEQIRGEPPGRGSDVWAFGCLFYQCLTGRPAFPGQTPHERLEVSLHHEPDWTALPETTPPSIRTVLGRCLEKDVDQRTIEFRTLRRTLDQEIESLRKQHVAPAPAESEHTNLPRTSGVFVGRRSERRAIGNAFAHSRLVTLTGPGGSGKTRLALEAAHDLASEQPDGVWFADLTPVVSPAGFDHALAAALRIQEAPPTPVLETVREQIAKKRLLVILDNCEHLLPRISPKVRELLDGAPHLRILATSRIPLRLETESVLPLSPLRIPDGTVEHDPDQMDDIDSVRLFLERCRDVDPDFVLDDRNAEAIARICVHLDGIPLALELAAARTRVRSPEEIAAELDRRKTLPGRAGRSAPGRTVSIQGLVGWSYRLLDDKEKHLLRRLAVFPGGWHLAAAEEVCSGHGLESWEIAELHAGLIDKSLVAPDRRSRPVTDRIRFRMLAPVREYMLGRLRAAGEERRTTRSFLHYCIAFVGGLQPYDRGPDSQTRVLQLQAEHDNLAGALEVALRPRGPVSLGLDLAVAMEKFWMIVSLWSEGRRYMEALVHRVRPLRTAHGHAWNGVGSWNLYTGHPDEAKRCYERALRVGRRVRDRDVVARSLHNLGGVALNQGDSVRARKLFNENLRMVEKTGDVAAIARVRSNMAVASEMEGDLADAARSYKQALLAARQVAEPRLTAILLNNLGAVLARGGQFADARPYIEEALQVAHEVGDRWTQALALIHLGIVMQNLLHDYETARSHFEEGLRIAHELGDVRAIAKAILLIGLLEEAAGEPRRGVRLIGAAENLFESTQHSHPPDHRRGIDQAIERCRAALGSTKFDRLYSEGHRQSMEDAIARALGR